MLVGYLANEDYDEAIRMYGDAIQRDAMNYWLWHGLCEIFVEYYGISAAVGAYKTGMEWCPTTLSPLLVLSNLYAAIETWTQHFPHRRDSLRVALSDSRDDLRGNKAKGSGTVRKYRPAN